MSRLSQWMDLIVGALTALSLGVAGWLALRKWLKKWISEVAADSREAARQLSTSNGKTVAQYVEQVAQEVKGAVTLAQDSARRADLAHALAEHAHRRLDDHMIRGHEPEKLPI